MRLLMLIFVCAILLVSSSAWCGGLSEFLILVGWPNRDNPDATAKALVDAGFNVAMWDADKLDSCRKYGLKALVMSPTLKMAEKLKNDPAVWGYYIVDEPLKNFPAVRAAVDSYTVADPSRPAYVNLVSRGGQYLADYMDIVQPEILSYDYYEWWWGIHGHYPKLEDHRCAALKADVPLIRWVEVIGAYGYEFEGHDKSRPADNEARLRRTVFTSLAYGVKGIQWFVGRLIFEDDWTTLNDCGRDVAAVNRELKVLGPTLMKLKSVDVFHMEPLPRGTRPVPPEYWVQMAESGYSHLVTGLFKDDDNTDYIMVSNGNFMYEKLAVLDFQEPVLAVEQLDKKTGEWVSLPISTEGISDENHKLINRNFYFQMYSQRTGGSLTKDMGSEVKHWLNGNSKDQFVEVMLSPGMVSCCE